jgi:hypothetical protein
MSSDSYDILRRAVVEALGPRATPERRRQIAAELRALAEQQERMAQRAEDAARALTRIRAPRRARAAGMYIRIRHEPDPHTRSAAHPPSVRQTGLVRPRQPAADRHPARRRRDLDRCLQRRGWSARRNRCGVAGVHRSRRHTSRPTGAGALCCNVARRGAGCRSA